MKKKVILALAVLLALVLLAAGSLYKRPAALAQLEPSLALESCTGLMASYAVNDATGQRPGEPVYFPADSEGFRLLMDSLSQQKFRKSFWNFLPAGDKTHLPAQGDFQWEIALTFDTPVALPDGSTAHGDLLRITNFYGALSIEGVGWDKPLRCSAENQQQWAEGILSILLRGPSAP